MSKKVPENKAGIKVEQYRTVLPVVRPATAIQRIGFPGTPQTKNDIGGKPPVPSIPMPKLARRPIVSGRYGSPPTLKKARSTTAPLPSFPLQAQPKSPTLARSMAKGTTVSVRGCRSIIQRKIGENAQVGEAVHQISTGRMGYILSREEHWAAGLVYYTVQFPGHSSDIEPEDKDYAVPPPYLYAFAHRTQVFVVDAHIIPPPCPNAAKQNPGVWSLNTSMVYQQDSRFCILKYGIAGIPDVYCYWPTVWMFECGAPAPNSYGWIVQAEFGTPVHQANPILNPNGYRAPFQYRNTTGALVTPSLPYDPSQQIPSSPMFAKQFVQKLLKG